MSSSRKEKGFPFARGDVREVRPVDFRTFRPALARDGAREAAKQEEEEQEKERGGEESSSMGNVEETQQKRHEEIWQERVEEARAEGYALAREEYEKELEALREQMKDQQDQLLSGLVQLEERARQRVLQVAKVLGKKYASHLINLELQEGEHLVAAVRGPLQRAYGMNNLRLFVHPDAVAPLEERLDLLVGGELERTAIEIVADGSLNYGDCRISAEEGQIESLLEERLDRLVDLTESRLESLSYSQSGLLSPES